MNEKVEIEDLKRKLIEITDDRDQLRAQIDDLYERLHSEKHKQEEDPRIIKLLGRINILEDENYGLKSIVAKKETFEQRETKATPRKADRLTVETENKECQTSHIAEQSTEASARRRRASQGHFIIQQQSSQMGNERKTVAHFNSQQFIQDAEKKTLRARELKGLLCIARLEITRLNNLQNGHMLEANSAN